MLETKMNIIFFPNKTIEEGNNSLNSEMINSLTFKFDDSRYFIGFLTKDNQVHEFVFGEKYLINVQFPSIDFNIYTKYHKKWEMHPVIDICTGKKVIGKAKIFKCQFKE